MRLPYKMAAAFMLLILALSTFPALGASPVHAATCDWAQFVADVTVPDGTSYAPGTAFRKTWRLKNIGSCTWTTSYALVFDSGEKMGAPSAVNFPSSVAPGQTVDLSVDMTAPSSAGHYFSYWKLRNASGAIFGIGSTANKAFWAEIYVSSSAGVGYDFTANAGSATWSSAAGTLAFPGADGDASGFALKKDKPKFESGVELGNPGLLVAPQNVYNGYIQGAYPAFRVEKGDRFQATIGCEYGATTCYVEYRLNYQIGSGAVKTFWTFREKYEGWTYNVNLNLDSLAGQDVKFILFTSAYGSATGDRSLWGNPVLSRAGGVVATFTPTVTGTPPTPTPTSTAPTKTATVPPSSCDKVQFISDVTVPDGTTFAPGTAFTKTWRLKNVGSCTWTTSYQLVFYSGEKMGGPDALAFPQSVAPGQTVDITVNLVAPNTAGTYRGNWMFKNASGALFGIGSQANKPWWVEIKVSGTAAATNTPTATTTPPTPTPTATATQVTTANWNTYQNNKYKFLFKFPPGSIVTTQTDSAGRIFLPFTTGTNLLEKFLDVSVVENANPCKTPTTGATSSQTVTINNISFLKEAGVTAATGNTYDFVAYSATKDNACISLTFTLHSSDQANAATPLPSFDKTAESAVFDTIMSTFSFGQ
ncbi:MAG: NBR1-Ig-like domain-containing protein [Chloroflexota bacterium]